MCPESPAILVAPQKTAAISNFKDWTNYLLVTTVAAMGWVSAQPADLMGKLCIACLALSVIAGIFTLALIPLITERLRDDPRSIYEVEATFTIWLLWGRQHSWRLKHVCWWQHVFFLVAISLFAARFVLKTNGIDQ